MDGLSVLCYCIVGCALCVSVLGLGDGCKVCTPVSCECNTAYSSLPYIAVFYICVRVGVAGKDVFVFFFAADKFFLIAVVCVLMSFVILLWAE